MAGRGLDLRFCIWKVLGRAAIRRAFFESAGSRQMDDEGIYAQLLEQALTVLRSLCANVLF